MVKEVGKEIVAKALNVSKKYQLGDMAVTALSEVSLNIMKGDFLALAGSSGSGKTTLLNLFGCLDLPSEGEIEFEGQKIAALNDRELAALRSKRIGFIFQTFNLIPVLSAIENVEYALLKSPLSHRQRSEKAAATLASVGLEKFLHRRPNQLSGGQRQRVAIARALVHGPAMIIADEPTANLDKTTSLEILKLMSEVNKRDSVTFVFSTHDPNILSVARRIVSISDGKITNDQAGAAL